MCNPSLFLDLLTSGSVICRDLAGGNISTGFDVDSSSCFLTDTQMELDAISTQSAIASVSNY